LRPQNVAESHNRQMKGSLFCFVAVQMVLYPIYPFFYSTPKIYKVIGLPILIAKGTAYGACFWTGVLFFTMSRDLIRLLSKVYCFKRHKRLVEFLNCQKDLHKFAGRQVLYNSLVHTLVHHIGTFVELQKRDTRTINDMLTCAKSEKLFTTLFKWMHSPCPYPENKEITYWDGVISTPGITGYLLLAVILAIAYFSSRKQRRENFRRFYTVHQLLVPCWVILLILHSVRNWCGLGFPVIIPLAGIPIIAYLLTIVRRQCFALAHASKVADAKSAARENLMRLDVKLGPSYHMCRVGEYAFINVPSIGLREWHPYTICGTRPQKDGSQVITFFIMSVGKWTHKLHATLCDADRWPKVNIDGPHYAPCRNMRHRATIVGVGSGVGISPFLSMLAYMSNLKDTKYQSVHVFWITQFATDFLLFKDLLSEVEENSRNEGKTTNFHLHSTGSGKGSGVGCVFELVAREMWQAWLQRFAAKETNKLPSFSAYAKPLYAVMTNDFLRSNNPLAVAVGRPDWVTELMAIGDANPSEDVWVYFCGNLAVQKAVQSTCIACNEHRERLKQSQRYYFFWERFE